MACQTDVSRWKHIMDKIKAHLQVPWPKAVASTWVSTDPRGQPTLGGITARCTFAGKVQPPSQSRLWMFPCVLRPGTALGGV